MFPLKSVVLHSDENISLEREAMEILSGTSDSTPTLFKT